jgi:hypothetical protein
MIPVIGVLDRYSQVADRAIRSRTTQGRIIDPIEYLVNNGQAHMKLVTAEQILRGIPVGVHAVIASRPNRRDDLEALAKLREDRIPLILDIDDDLYSYPRWSKLRFSREEVDFIVDCASFVSVTNATLYARFHASEKPSRIVQSGFYVEKYCTGSIPIGEGFRVTMCNGDNLKSDDFSEEFCDLIYHFVEENSDVYFDYFGDDAFPAPKHPRIKNYVGLSFDEHKRELLNSSYSLTVMMLGNKCHDRDAFFEAKSPVKYWEHGGFGIPGIFSNNAIYKACINDGENGFLAENNVGAWRDRLYFAYNNRSRLRDIGQNAKTDVTERYHIREAAGGFLSIVREL